MSLSLCERSNPYHQNMPCYIMCLGVLCSTQRSALLSSYREPRPPYRGARRCFSHEKLRGLGKKHPVGAVVIVVVRGRRGRWHGSRRPCPFLRVLRHLPFHPTRSVYLLVAHQCTRTHWPHPHPWFWPPPWPSHSFPFQFSSSPSVHVATRALSI
jgi:hypothetical protein